MALPPRKVRRERSGVSDGIGAASADRVGSFDMLCPSLTRDTPCRTTK